MNAVIEILNGMNAISVAFRILLAVVMGGCIGSERGRHGRAAGLRTHILVCLGSALTTMMGLYTTQVLGFTNDPLRMGAQVISGIGFLGAGTIMVRNRSHVMGLTTAAGLWATACIGLCVGVGFYEAAVIAFAVVMFSISVLSKMEHSSRNRANRAYYIELTDVNRVKTFCNEMGQYITDVDIVPAKSGVKDHVGLEFVAVSKQSRTLLLEMIRAREDIIIAIPLHQ